MDFMEASDKVDKTLRCVCIRWSPDDEVDDNVETKWTQSRQKWFGVEPFDGCKGTVNVVGSNHGLQPFTKDIKWTQPNLYINLFMKSRS